MKILMVMSGLNRGGTERQVATLFPALQRHGHEITVLVPFGGDHHERELRAAGVDVVVAHRGRRGEGRSVPSLLFRGGERAWNVVRLTGAKHTDIVHGFGLATNLYAAATKPIHRRKVVWGVRSSLPEMHLVVRALERYLSHFADLIICNSEAGRTMCLENGMNPDRIVVIGNGIDVERNRIEPAWREAVREELGVREDESLIGIVGRIDTDKNQEAFLRAAAMVGEKCHGARFVVIGTGEETHVRSLKEYASTLGIDPAPIWTGARDDVERCLNALDVLVSTSRTEGFPNVIAEAMAVGVPCVVTDAGESAQIVGELGKVVSDGSANRVSDAIIHVLHAERDGHALKRRATISGRYSPETMVRATEEALKGLLR